MPCLFNKIMLIEDIVSVFGCCLFCLLEIFLLDKLLVGQLQWS